MGNGLCMRLSSIFFRCLSPLGDLSYNCLPAVMDVDMLDCHLLLAFAAVPECVLMVLTYSSPALARTLILFD